MTLMLSQPKSVEIPSRNKEYPGNALLINATVQDAALNGELTEVHQRLEACIQQVLGKIDAKWKQYSLVGIVFSTASGSRKAFIDIDAKSIAKGMLARQYTYNVVAKG